MSNALRNVAETTAHAWSDLVDEARDLVDEARDRMPDLPPLGRHRKSNKRWLVMAIVGVVVVMVAMAGKRRRTQSHRPTNDSSPGARLTEKSLAVS